MEALLADGKVFIDQLQAVAVDARRRATDARAGAGSGGEGEGTPGPPAEARKAAARARLADQQVKLALRALSEVKGMVDEALEGHAASVSGGGSGAGIGEIHAKMLAWRDGDAAYELLGDRDEGAERAQAAEAAGAGTRAGGVADEAAVGALQAAHPAADPTRLLGVIRELRELEGGVDFQAAMRQSLSSTAAESGYSEENFAYGSTPFATWLKVFAVPAVQGGLALCREGAKSYMVWGSSSGWLVFYGALTFGVRSVGCELLACHVDTSTELAARHGVERAEFVAGDMLASDLGEVGVLMLASQCWDRDLQERAAEKIRSELPPGSVVVDYSARICELCGREPAETIELPVSWNPAQKMCVFVM